MATIFWDEKGVLLVECLEQGKSITCETYCETLQKLRRAIKNKRRGLLTKGVLFLHDNARPHTAARTVQLLQNFKWEILEHPPYSPDLAPSDYHLFQHLKNWLGSKSFHDDEELKDAVGGWLKGNYVETHL